MMITLNGEPYEAPTSMSVAALVEQLSLDVRTIAVERNLEIVHRPDYPQALLQEGDKLEIIHFIGGG